MILPANNFDIPLMVLCMAEGGVGKMIRNDFARSSWRIVRMIKCQNNLGNDSAIVRVR